MCSCGESRVALAERVGAEEGLLEHMCEGVPDARGIPQNGAPTAGHLGVDSGGQHEGGVLARFGCWGFVKGRFGLLCHHAHPRDYKVRDGHEVAAVVGFACLLEMAADRIGLLSGQMKRAAQKTVDSFFKTSGAPAKLVKRSERRSAWRALASSCVHAGHREAHRGTWIGHRFIV